jgi:hypothetical protein
MVNCHAIWPAAARKFSIDQGCRRRRRGGSRCRRRSSRRGRRRWGWHCCIRLGRSRWGGRSWWSWRRRRRPTCCYCLDQIRGRRKRLGLHVFSKSLRDKRRTENGVQ